MYWKYLELFYVWFATECNTVLIFDQECDQVLIFLIWYGMTVTHVTLQNLISFLSSVRLQIKHCDH